MLFDGEKENIDIKEYIEYYDIGKSFLELNNNDLDKFDYKEIIKIGCSIKLFCFEKLYE